MKRAAALCLLLAALPLCGRVYPQFGVEAFMGGAYDLFSLAPWGGVRLGLNASSSLIVKFRQQSVAFDVEDDEGLRRRSTSQLSMVTGVYYLQKGKLDAYGALFQMFGSGGYNASGVDVGLAWRVLGRVAAETGLYLLNERSNLWYPDEERRRISTWIWHVGAKIAVRPRLELQPQLFFGNNNEGVGTFSYALSLNYAPSGPLYLTLTYTRYSEKEEVRFSGDYFSGGINFYF